MNSGTMVEFFGKLFNTEDFSARWHCGNWTDGHGWLHVISDCLVWGGYTTIPLVMFYFIRRRKDIVFPRIFWLFGLFILTCGTVHLIEASIFWWPAYRLAGIMKLITAVVSWMTVIALVKVIPQAIRLPGLQEVNKKLEDEVEERRKAEQRFRVMVESAPNGIILINSAGKILIANQRLEELFGYAHNELIGSELEILVPDRLRSGHVGMRLDYFGNPKARQMGSNRDLFGLRKDGVEIPIEIGLNPIDLDGQTCVLAAVVDISERKRTQMELERYARQLEKSNRELDEFTRIASHDLKAPMRGIDNLSQWIEEDALEVLPDESKRHLSQLRRRVQRMERMLDDLRQYARVSSDRHSVEKVDTTVLLNEICDLVAVPASFEVVLDPGMPVFETERVPLEQVFRNLVSNAVKHHPGGEGRIEVSSASEGDFFRFSVSDNGPGIPDEFHERIFKMFETLQSRDIVEASGIGLALVRKIVDSYGGKVHVESAEGKGATFTFLWPRYLAAKKENP